MERVRVSSKQNHPLYHASYIELLNDVIEPVTFAHSTGPGVTYVLYMHTYIYILEDCAVLLVWGEPAVLAITSGHRTISG